jgi:hypothetical protein|tara:strand:+ start:166 stop:345 length:180 start_codon:yes stop_codon:yes gene_type:complete
MQVSNWGLFVERPNMALHEIRLTEELATLVWEFLQNLEEDDGEYILPRNLDPEEKYKIW